MSSPNIPATPSYLPPLSTPVELPAAPFQLTQDDSILCLGSCFAQEVGERLQHQLAEGRVCVNPLGPLYSPQVVAALLDAWMRDVPPAAPFRGRDGLWHSWQASSVCSAATEEECRSRLAAAWEKGREALRTASLVVITFGTTRAYHLRAAHQSLPDSLVANCHKEPPSLFLEQQPALAELTSAWQELLLRLTHFNPQARVLLTVSPYRYKKYGLHASQLQKATLLLLCDALQNAGLAHYFPAYEILLDELRDYRFYAADMLHPSPQAVDIIAERFRRWLFTPALLAEADDRLRQWRQGQHRPLL